MFMERQDPQVMSNFSRSTTNLLPRKQQSYQQSQQNQGSARQFHKYQSNRDTVLMKSPQLNPKFSASNISNISAFLPKNENLNASATPQDLEQRKGGTQPFANLNNSQQVHKH